MVVEVSVDDRAPIAPEETLSTASGTEAAA
jgi:hypothetical protein